MYQYFVYGMRMCSDLAFSQLLSIEEGGADAPEITVEAAAVPPELAKIRDRRYAFGAELSWLSNQTAWLLVRNGNHIGYMLKPGGNPEYLKTYILGFGLAMLALQRNMLAIHCSAVADETGAVLIAGESGAGKSTLTSALLSEGWSLMADDMAVLMPRRGEKPLVFSGFPYQKLCRDEAVSQGYDLEKLLYINEEKDKFFVPYSGKFPTAPQQVKAMILLGRTAGPSVRTGQAMGIEKLHAVAGNLFLRKLLGAQCYRPDIGQLCLDAASQMPILLAARPGTGDTREEMVRKALEFLQQLS